MYWGPNFLPRCINYSSVTHHVCASSQITKTHNILGFCSCAWGISENFPERKMYISGAYYLNEFQSKHLLYFTHRKTHLYETEKAHGQLCLDS